MNFWDLVKEVPILDVAKDIGIKVVKEMAGYAIAVCPFHEDHTGGGGKPNLSLKKETNGYKCFNCGASGTVIDLYANHLQVTPEAALKALAAKYGIQDPQAKPVASGVKSGPPAESQAGQPAEGDPKGKAGKGGKKPKAPKEPWDAARIEKACARLFDPANADHLSYFCNLRKVTPEYVKAKKIGIDMVWGINDEKAADLAYTIPVFDKAGKVLAVRTHSRLWRKNKKVIAGFTSKVLYDLTTFDPNAPELHIPEGEGDLWTLDHQLHRNALTSPSGAPTIPLVFQENLAALGDLTKKTRIVFYPDNDSVGRECMARIRFLMPKEAPCFKVYWPANYAHKQDVSHWINELGRTVEELDSLIKTYSWDEAQADLLEIEKKKQQIEAMKKLGIRVKEEANAYWRMKNSKDGVDWEPISNFVIRGKATIEVGSQAYTKADILVVDGAPENDRQLPPDMWLGKRDFLKAFPHTRYQFYGSDTNIQQIKGLVTKTIPKEAVKRGVEVIGIHDDVFVGPGFAITKDGIVENPTIEYVKQNLPLEENFTVVLASDAKPILQDFLANTFKVNKPQVTIPTLGWMFSCFFKEKVRALIQYFPILSFFGTSGSGKTTFAQTMLRLFGIKKNTQLMNANTSQFTAMRMLACTNCIPLAIDELKEDAGPLIIDFWKRHARSAYGGETETRGRQDLSVKSYTYKAPLFIVGEMSILREKATIERTISVEPKLSDHNQETRDAFYALRELQIEALFPKVVQWVLSEGNPNMIELWNKGKESLKAMEFPNLPPRVWDNYTTVMFGIEALEAFSKSMGAEFTVPQETRRQAVAALVGEVLTVAKRTKLGFDDFLEALAIMAKNDVLKSDKDYVRRGEWLYIHLPSCVSAFRKWARDTRHDGDVLGKKEYRAQAKEIMKMSTGRYVFEIDKVWKFGENPTRSIQISLRRAEHAGLDVTGFGYSEEKAAEEWDTPASSGSEEEDAKEAQLPPELTEETPPEPAAEEPSEPPSGDLFDNEED